MNAVALPPLATLYEGGYYAGKILIDERPFALIVAPKDEGEHEPAIWIARSKDVPDALSYFDGAKNTQAMADAGSKLAQWAVALSSGGFRDWYLPSQDELEVCYRAMKPTTETNSLYGRSGINASALPPTYPYSPVTPLQTEMEAFRAGGTEAFEPDGYWSSTQHASYSCGACYQDFNDGDQDGWGKDSKLRARAVRRLPL